MAPGSKSLRYRWSSCLPHFQLPRPSRVSTASAGNCGRTDLPVQPGVGDPPSECQLPWVKRVICSVFFRLANLFCFQEHKCDVIPCRHVTFFASKPRTQPLRLPKHLPPSARNLSLRTNQLAHLQHTSEAPAKEPLLACGCGEQRVQGRPRCQETAHGQCLTRPANPPRQVPCGLQRSAGTWSPCARLPRADAPVVQPTSFVVLPLEVTEPGRPVRSSSASLITGTVAADSSCIIHVCSVMHASVAKPALCRFRTRCMRKGRINQCRQRTISRVPYRPRPAAKQGLCGILRDDTSMTMASHDNQTVLDLPSSAPHVDLLLSTLAITGKQYQNKHSRRTVENPS